ncbi:MAG TPA: serine/threonine protein kinase [Polyangiaceae bacterium]
MKTIAQTSRTLLAALLALGAFACTPTFATPKGFVELDENGTYDQRATTADGLVLAGRKIENDPEGDLAFWSHAVENQMRMRGGYALLEKRKVKTAGGFEGEELRFGHDEGNKPHLYYVALFVTKGNALRDGTIYLIEAGGPKELVEKNTASIDWAIEHARVD